MTFTIRNISSIQCTFMQLGIAVYYLTCFWITRHINFAFGFNFCKPVCFLFSSLWFRTKKIKIKEVENFKPKTNLNHNKYVLDLSVTVLVPFHFIGLQH